jgi:hypothetical protein
MEWSNVILTSLAISSSQYDTNTGEQADIIAAVFKGWNGREKEALLSPPAGSHPRYAKNDVA